jgi:hypothetical protein
LARSEISSLEWHNRQENFHVRVRERRLDRRQLQDTVEVVSRHVLYSGRAADGNADIPGRPVIILAANMADEAWGNLGSFVEAYRHALLAYRGNSQQQYLTS